MNIAEILKDCPKGTKLYSPLCGECTYKDVSKKYYDKHFRIIVETIKDTDLWFNEFGRYFNDFTSDECLLFPSKENRDWSTFQRPFKDGDILATEFGSVFILNTDKNDDLHYGCYVGLTHNGDFLNVKAIFACRHVCHFASEEEKQKLFDAIKENGYKWNVETKTLEKLIIPKFKVVDRVRGKVSKKEWEVTLIDEYYYYDRDLQKYVIEKQDHYELVHNKFDIPTLKPFESKVLVRDYDNQIWIPTFWGKYLEDDSNCRYLTTNGCYKYCIPYEGNEHLLGTTNDCDEYYKTW